VTARGSVGLGATLTILGIALAATSPVESTAFATGAGSRSTVGGVVTLLGWALLAWGIHALGRGRS
jgi:hypothetical protein